MRQEFYGWVLALYAVRWLLHQGATRHRIAHEELSFTGHVQLLRRAQPRSGAFPPQRPRRRRRWFNELLEASAAKRATRTLHKRSPRMVKRRNSPYASHDRNARTQVPIDCTPAMLGPMPRRTTAQRAPPRFWSPDNPSGGMALT